MESVEAVTAANEEPWVGRLVRVGIRPRQTMRRILDLGRDRMVVPLVLLAYVSAIFGDLSFAELRQVQTAISPLTLAGLVAGVLICGPLIAILIFYGLSWLVARVGRLLDGEGGTREVRSAMAWGLAPFIWALLYRIPASFFMPASAEGRALEVSELVQRGAAALAFGFVELLVLIWYLIVTSATVGEAHGFSTLKGFATLMIVFIIPFILAAAAVLTIVT
jgi:Yip1-like protein